MKKLCFITTVESTLESFVIPAVREIAKRGGEVTLICSMSEAFKEKYSSEFNCINVTMKRGFSLSDMIVKPIEFFRIFRKEKFDYVQYATTNAAWYASLAAKLAGVPIRVNCLWGLLYTASKGLRRKIYWLAEKYPCLFSNYFVVASRKNMGIAIKDRLCRQDNSEVIGDGGTVGVDLNVFDSSNRCQWRVDIQRLYPNLKGKFVYGYVGRIDVDKGINELLNAFLSLEQENIALILIGPFDDLRSGLDDSLLERAKKASNIVFTGFTKDVARHLAIVDVLAHPTYREGFSMVIQQAMAMGCAIITTDIPGPSEVIEANVSGLLVPVKDAEMLKQAMAVLYENNDMKENLVTAGLKRVREKFSRERMIELTYESMMSKINKNE